MFRLPLFALNPVLIHFLAILFSHLGENRAFAWFKWNRANGRYSEYDYQNEIAENCSGLVEDSDNWIVDSENNTKQESIDFISPNKNIEPNYDYYSTKEDDPPF